MLFWWRAVNCQLVSASGRWPVQRLGNTSPHQQVRNMLLLPSACFCFGGCSHVRHNSEYMTLNPSWSLFDVGSYYIFTIRAILRASKKSGSKCQVLKDKAGDTIYFSHCPQWIKWKDQANDEWIDQREQGSYCSSAPALTISELCCWTRCCFHYREQTHWRCTCETPAVGPDGLTQAV